MMVILCATTQILSCSVEMVSSTFVGATTCLVRSYSPWGNRKAMRAACAFVRASSCGVCATNVRPTDSTCSTALKPSARCGLRRSWPFAKLQVTPSKLRSPCSSSNGTSSIKIDFAPATRPAIGPADNKHKSRNVPDEAIVSGTICTPPCWGICGAPKLPAPVMF